MKRYRRDIDVMINVWIDDLTPCLKDNETGDFAVFLPILPSEFVGCLNCVKYDPWRNRDYRIMYVLPILACKLCHCHDFMIRKMIHAKLRKCNWKSEMDTKLTEFINFLIIPRLKGKLP